MQTAPVPYNIFCYGHLQGMIQFSFFSIAPFEHKACSIGDATRLAFFIKKAIIVFASFFVGVGGQWRVAVLGSVHMDPMYAVQQSAATFFEIVRYTHLQEKARGCTHWGALAWVTMCICRFVNLVQPTQIKDAGLQHQKPW